MGGELVYLAPGAGLGHLTRAVAVAGALEDLGVPVRVVTQSPFAPALEAQSGCLLEWIPENRWEQDLAAFVSALRPRLLVVDSFPSGLRQEWAGGWPAGIPRVLMARRLRWEDYLRAHPPSPGFLGAIELESLDPGHRIWLETVAQEVVRLPGRIRTELGTTLPPETAALDRDAEIDLEDSALVVHSGPPREVEALLELARQHLGESGARQLVLVSPVPPTRREADLSWREGYPVAGYFPRAALVVTGGGYNSVAEGRALARRHLALAFPRRWDDQEGRLAELESEGQGRTNGLTLASEKLAAWWQATG